MRLINETVFTDLFIICLAARADTAEDTRAMCATVGAFTKILEHMQILSDGAHKRLIHNVQLQTHFRRHLEIVPSSAHMVRARAECQRPLLVSNSAAGDFDRVKMLRDMRIIISDHGFAYAARIEDSYTDILTGEQFLEARQEREEKFAELSEVAQASILARWRQRNKLDDVEREVE
jgi:hypothetical protein